jgi:hypothetical protein
MMELSSQASLYGALRFWIHCLAQRPRLTRLRGAVQQGMAAVADKSWHPITLPGGWELAVSALVASFSMTTSTRGPSQKPHPRYGLVV